MFIAPTRCQCSGLYTYHGTWSSIAHSLQMRYLRLGSAIAWSSSYCQGVDKLGINPLVSDSQAYLNASHCTPKVEYVFSPSGMIQGAVNWLMRRSELGPTHRTFWEETLLKVCLLLKASPGCFYG